tara:strand:- start:207 stop:326 length:120 start_codon:yes stop_codon:yes gene_type:complete
MMRFYHNRHTPGLANFQDSLSYLFGETLLHLETPSEHFH